ncbi:hypothetical protein [Massilia sp. BKSP1R2A-1]|uniref:hypothetical protein n=1 Tax=Massilia sp. BKSP1R2A-1 TaxID=3422595 RepID=UPI003D334329
MRYWLAIVGAAVAAATRHWSPAIFDELIKATGFASGFLTLGGLLTASWAGCLTKLSAFEKLEDLPTDSRERVMNFARNTRKKVIATVITNVLLAAASITTVLLAQLPSLQGVALPVAMTYLLCVTLGFWCGGLFDSWRLYQVIEASREAMLVAQIEIKKRTTYVAKMRKDATESPIAKGDAHLNGYTTNV